MAEHWIKRDDGRFCVAPLVNIANVPDRTGIVNIDEALPGLVPMAATSLILTVERGFLSIPPSGFGCVSLRVMPRGYSLSDMLDRAKTQEWVMNHTGVDVIAQDVRMPIDPENRSFFWALQSSCPAETNKMAIIDLWGWTV